MSALRLAPLRDLDRDARLFVRPEGYERLRAAAAAGRNVLVLGPRGAGKTSVLRQLQRELRQAGEGAPVVFADLAGVAGAGAALQVLAATAAEALDAAPAWSPPVLRPGEDEEQRDVRLGLRQLADLPACRFLVDNADPGAVAHPLFGVLRDRLWETPHTWVLTGVTHDRPRLLRPPADAFWEEVVELAYSAAQARELLERRLDGPADWVAPLVAEVGTVPRQLVRAAQEAERDPEAALAERRSWRERREALDDRGARLLAELDAVAPASASDPELLERLGWARTTLQRSLEALEEQGLVASWTEPTGKGRPRRVFAPTGPGGWGRG
ncbi:MAG: hypothetical protein HZB46_07065 [Solirubrobacterales bacterium]|nr:hypothetical protein [Solirubrobacterales bacterium]